MRGRSAVGGGGLLGSSEVLRLLLGRPGGEGAGRRGVQDGERDGERGSILREGLGWRWVVVLVGWVRVRAMVSEGEGEGRRELSGTSRRRKSTGREGACEVRLEPVCLSSFPALNQESRCLGEGNSRSSSFDFNLFKPPLWLPLLQ